MKPLAKLVNTTSQTLAAGANILFTSAIINSSSIGYSADGSIQLKTPGVYKIYGNFDVAPTGTSAQVGLYEGTSAVPGAEATSSVVATETTNLSFATILTVKPLYDNSYATISFKDITAGSITNANVLIEKIYNEIN